MKVKYIIYLILFVCLTSILIFNDSNASKKNIKTDTINIFYDDINQEFFIDKYERYQSHRERLLLHENLVLVDCTDIDQIKIKICKEKTNYCVENKMKNIRYKVGLGDGLYRLKISTTDRNPIIRNNFYIRNLETE